MSGLFPDDRLPEWHGFDPEAGEWAESKDRDLEDQMRRWLRFLNPKDFGLPSWIRTIRPLSHLAENCLTYDETGDADIYCRAHVLDSKRKFFEILRDAEMEEDLGWASSGLTWAGELKVGKEGFKVVDYGNGPELAPSRGGVWIGENVSIGASTCVDRGIYGEFTEIHDGAKIDNLVHVAHSVVIGRGAFIVAGTILGGWCEIGQSCWIGMGAKILPHVKVGEGSYVGAGAVVNRDVPPHSLVYGSPARIKGHACCQRKLVFEGTLAKCPVCEREFGLKDGEIVPC